MADRVRVGVVGTGAISGAYLQTASTSPILEVVALADLNAQAAQAKAAEFNIPRVLSVEDLLKDPSIEIVLNLTVPKAHASIAIRALRAGKHTFIEKPLAVDRHEGREILDVAQETGLRVGCAPDTFLGAGIQTARKLIDDGAIGRPVAFTAFMMCRGHESWHPSPEFYYEAGAGPMFDMGPYYLTALLNLLGPVARVAGVSSIAIPERLITSEPQKGKTITVETPDHIAGLMEFTSGVTGTITQSFAVMHSPHPPITIFGTEGTLAVPDPNLFDGEVKICRAGATEFTTVSPTSPTGYGRGVGLADMATAIRAGKPHRCSLEQAYLVLDLMEAFLDTSDSGRFYKPVGEYERPAAVES